VYAKTIGAAVAAGLLSLAGGFANASVTVVSNSSAMTVYQDRAAFTAASARVFTDSFDDLGFGDLGPVLPRTIGAATYTVAAGDGLFGTGGLTDRYISTTFPDSTLLFAGFSPDARGFGGNFFGADENGVPVRASSIDVTVVDATGTLVLSIDNSSATDFVGFLSSVQIQAAVFSGESDRYYPTINDVAVALAPVPEPGTYAMLLAGLAVLPFATRRRPT